ncbi:MAG: hypothetical protein IMZ61_14090 [Planctomycetes bacterium]|nr:hypothetical protein [Chloroflexota bacterium]MBE3145029.1 hypothetical protein [Planctomycetota bacterium]
MAKIILAHASNCYLRASEGSGELFCSCGSQDAMNKITRLTTENKALKKRARAAESNLQDCEAELLAKNKVIADHFTGITKKVE